ncbi:MAG: hypothetical protein ABIZ50_02345 [Solirubrobacterales bacterium]
MSPRDCDDAVAAGRLKKAEQFLRAALDVEELSELKGDEADVRDAIVTLCVHSGIAAADVICCKRLGQYSLGGEGHTEAAGLLMKVTEPDGKQLAKRLGQLLKVKTKAGYKAQSVSTTDHRTAKRAAEQLVKAARELS